MARHAIHPGEQLEALEMSAAESARKLRCVLPCRKVIRHVGGAEKSHLQET